MFKRLPEDLKGWIYLISKWFEHVSALVLFILMLITLADVLSRKLIHKSILGTVELSEFMLLIVVSFSLAHAEVLNRHVRVDLVVSRFGNRAQNFIDAVTQLVCASLFGLTTWSTLIYAASMRTSREVSIDLWIPRFPFVYVVVGGWVLLSLVLLIKSIFALGKAVKS